MTKIIKILDSVRKVLYNYFVKCGMSDEEWAQYLDMKKNPVFLRYKWGCIYLYKNRNDKNPFRIIKDGQIIWEETKDE